MGSRKDVLEGKRNSPKGIEGKGKLWSADKS